MDKNIKPLKDLLDSVRDIEGFPIGKNEDILALSDPPYYTACPNPYINNFIEENGKSYDEKTDDYNCEPFVGDVSENKYEKIYKFHSYSTKVPPNAIKKFIEHYTVQGDVVLDVFAGTGMTAVAASKLQRNCILIDLSSAATHISRNNNAKIPSGFIEWFDSLIVGIKKEFLWMYQTDSSEEIKYTVWSEVLSCPYCKKNNSYWDMAVEYFGNLDRDNNGIVNQTFQCKSCKAQLTKSITNRVTEDNRLIFKPVLINCRKINKKVERVPNNKDLELIDRIDSFSNPNWEPSIPYLLKGRNWGDSWRAGYHTGIENLSDFFSKRTLIVLSAFWDKINKGPNNYKNLAMFVLTATFNRSTKLVRYMPQYKERNVGPLSGTLYVPSLFGEINVFNVLEAKYKQALLSLNKNRNNNVITSTQSSTDLANLPDNSIDYVFVDPPFGDNLMYSELNFIIEGWLKIYTNQEREAIVSKSQNKDEFSYKQLIELSFKQIYRKLKPNRWLTVEFHNSKSSIWNAIQDALSKAGFIIAQVVTIDKKKGTTKQLTYTAGTVKHDLVINAYKPKNTFEAIFLSKAGDGLEQEFIEMHLSHLKSEPTVERTEQMLYSKTLAYYVQRSYTVKYNSKTFFQMLKNHFKEEDGFWFNPDQLTAYREYKKKMKLNGIDSIKMGQSVMFVQDEKSALIWLHAFLDEPKDFQAIHPAFTKIATIGNDQVPELQQLLEDNFINENGKYRRPSSEGEKFSLTEKRERSLRKEFDQLLLESKGPIRKIKECRVQAIVYGFEQCYKQERYQDILALAKKLDKNILENNSEVTEFIEVAEIKIHGV